MYAQFPCDVLAVLPAPSCSSASHEVESATRIEDHRRFSVCAGAYTTARTVHRTTVFDLTFHVNRLAETARLMCEQPTQSIDGSNGSSNARTHLPEELLSAETLRPLVVQALRSAIGHFETACPQHEGELKLTVLTHGEGDRPNVCAHVSPLPPRPAPPVKVQVRSRGFWL